MEQEKSDIREIVAEAKAAAEQKCSEDRRYLEIIKNDTEFLTDKDKEEILSTAILASCEIKEALRIYLEGKYEKETKCETIRELFPEIYEKIC